MAPERQPKRDAPRAERERTEARQTEVTRSGTPRADPARADPARAEPARAERDAMARAVARQGERRERSRREGRHGIGYGLGMFGLIGWSVAIPTLLGIALGVWIDRATNSPYSWTLMLMIAGVALGCFNAWYWLRKEAGLDDDEG